MVIGVMVIGGDGARRTEATKKYAEAWSLCNGR